MFGPRNHVDNRTEEQKLADREAFMAKMRAASEAKEADAARYRESDACKARMAAFNARCTAPETDRF